jgi:hypothetical protein
MAIAASTANRTGWLSSRGGFELQSNAEPLERWPAAPEKKRQGAGPGPSMIIPDACSLPNGVGQLPDKLARSGVAARRAWW